MPDKLDYGRFSLEFGTDGHELTAEAYAAVLTNTVVLIDEYSNELESGAKFRIKVRAERRGSYITDLVMQAGEAIGVTSSLITIENLSVAKAFATKVVKGVASCWELAKKLRGETPTKITQAGNGNVNLYAPNATAPITVNVTVAKTVTENETAKDAIAKTFAAVESEHEINEIKLIGDGKKELAAIPKHEFPHMAKKPKAPSERKRIKRVGKALLSINRQSFRRKKKSDFVYAGNEISALIDDEAFWQRIDRGEKFAKGDKLVSSLEIHQELDESAKVYKNISYKISKVLDHRPRIDQPELFPEQPKTKRPKR